MRRGDLKGEDKRQKLNVVEKALIVLGIATALALFGYLAYEAATTPSGARPEVSVEPAPGGAWVVLRNVGGAGILDARIQATCAGEELPDIEFTHIPADSRRRVHVTCEGAVEAVLAWWSAA